MRNLKEKEIEILKNEQRCWADNWNNITVDDNFETSSLRNVNFYGLVKIGKNVRITDTKMIKGSGKSAKPKIISVLNEGGDGNIVLSHLLTAQTAYLMMNHPSVLAMATLEAEKELEVQGGKEMTIIGDGAVIEGASKIVDSYIDSSEDAPTYIGTDVIIEEAVTACGATIDDGAKVADSFVGEAVHIGKGFSSEASLFFANAYMDNGEACAALCGPFACSHHKSTLLIGGEFSFYNAGSNTNQSNHAYKMGPIHWGTLRRGAKTASGCHILWPATIGAFSMVMGKLTQHPDLDNLPFSYVMSDPAKTYVVPGINIKTVGTWRDINKWPKRDARKDNARRDIVHFEFLTPYIIQFVQKGIDTLKEIRSSQGDVEEYTYQNCFIKKSALEKGLRYYSLIIDLAAGHTVSQTYIDMLGCIISKNDEEKLVAKIENGAITSSYQITDFLRTLPQPEEWLDRNSQAYTQWLEMVKEDAQKEFDMGDVEKAELDGFVSKLK